MKQPFQLTNPVHFLALGFGSGLIKPAPGTWGTLATLPIYALMVSVISPQSIIYPIIVSLMFCLGVYLCGKTATDIGVHDHGSIVWDEIVGFLITLTWFEVSLVNVIVGFVLFRIFDIAKPWPIKQLDRKVHGGFGIMIDDVLAGMYAWLVLYALHWAQII